MHAVIYVVTGTELFSQENAASYSKIMLHNYVTTQIIIFNLHAHLEIYSTHLTIA